MSLSFLAYFIRYVFFGKSRQSLLLLAVSGLFISSFSLLVLQSVMGGLQYGVVNESKKLHSFGKISLKDDTDVDLINFVHKKLSSQDINYVAQYNIELIAKNKHFIAPVTLRGIDLKRSTLPDFLEKKDISGVVLGSSLAKSLKLFFDDQVVFVSPAHIDLFISEMPRQMSSSFSDAINVYDDKIDKMSAWVDINKIYSLTRKIQVKDFVFYTDQDFQKAKKALATSEELVVHSWESENKSLVWALKLETTIMIVLFVAMSLLVAISITCGYMIFFDKAKLDLMSFWILGYSKKKAFRLYLLITQFMNISFSLIGILCGFGVLFGIKSKLFDFLPDFLIDSSMAIDYSLSNTLSSFLIPYIIATVFSFFSFVLFKNENSDFLKNIRTVS